MTLLELFRDLAALGTTLWLAGWLFGLLVLPEPLTAGRRVFVSLALGVPVVILLSLPGLLIYSLTARSLALVFALLALTVAWRRRSSLSALQDLRSVTRLTRSLDYRRRLSPILLVVLLGWFAVVGPQVLSRRPSWLPPNGWVWYYIGLARVIATQGSIPSTVVEWGAPRPFPSEYLFHSIHLASTGLLAGGLDLFILEFYRIGLVLVGLIAAYALWRRFLPAWWAWTAALLTMSAERMAFKFLAQWPETLGIVLVLWSGWMLDEGFDRPRSFRWWALLGLVSASAFLSHAQIWLLTGPLWAGIILARLLPSLYARRGDLVWRGQLKRLRSVLYPASVGIACAAAFVLTVLGTGLLAGDLGRITQLASTEQASPETAAMAHTTDPTWLLQAAIYHPELLDRPPPNFCRVLRNVYVLHPFERLDLRTTEGRLALAAGLVLLIGTLPLLPMRARRGVAVGLIFILGLYVGASMFCVVYDQYVPGRAGGQRLMPNYSMGLAGLLTCVGLGVSTALVTLIHRARGGRWGAVGSTGVTLAISLSLLVVFTHLTNGPVRKWETGMSRSAHQAYIWFGANVPRDSVVLVNAFTAGSVHAASGRQGWLDGRAPYLEEPEWRSSATEALLNARAYFRNPRKHSDKLPPEVDYVLLVRPQVNPGGKLLPANFNAFANVPELRRLRSFGRGDVVLYEVVRPAAGQ